MASPNNYEPLRETQRQVDADMSGPQRPEQSQQQQAPQSQQARQPQPELQGITPLEAAEANDKERLQLAREMTASRRYSPAEVSWHVRNLDQRELADEIKKDEIAAQKGRVEAVQDKGPNDEQKRRAEELAQGVRQQQPQQTYTQTQQKGDGQEK